MTVNDAALSITSVTHPAATEGLGTGIVTVATFTDAAGVDSDIGDLSAVITWADGAITAGMVVPTGTPGSYTVTGSHTYADEINTAADFTVAVSDSGGASDSLTIHTATVADADLTGSSAATATGGIEGVTVATLNNATFTDANPGDHTGDFTATITWGDLGPTSIGTVSYSGGTYTVDATHLYAEEGDYSFSIAITDDGGKTTSITGSATVADADLTGSTAATATGGIEGVHVSTLGNATFSDANHGDDRRLRPRSIGATAAARDLDCPRSSRAAAAATAWPARTSTPRKGPTTSRSP